MGKYIASVMLLLAILSSSCKNNQKSSACGTQVCSALFVTINVTFTNKNGTPTSVQNLTVVNQRTGVALFNQLPSNTTGNYVIASDSNLKLLSADGDNLTVTATNPSTGAVTTFTEKVAGGACACHVSKVSGADTVTLN